MKKYIIAGIFLICLGAVYIAYKTYNKEHKNLNELKADYEISAEALLAEFESDEAAAEAKYLNKIIKVRAVLLKKQEVGDKTIWVLSTGNPLSNIQCEMDPRYIKNIKADIQNGQTITVQGLCSGKLMDIVLNQVVYIL